MLRIETRRWAALAFIASLAACGSESGTGEDDQEAKNSGVTDDDDESSEDEEDAPKKDAGKDAGKRDSGGAAKPDSGTAPARGDAGAGGGDVPTAGDALPCEVAKVVEDKCSHCRGEKPVSATFSLVTAADFQAPGNSDDSKKLYEIAQTRVTATSKPMPPDAKLSAAELKTLTDWLKSGAKGSDEKCTGGGTGGEPGEVPIKGGSGGAHAQPIEYDDPDLKCYKLTAFGGDLNEPYSVPTTPDFYVAFNVPAPWDGVQYALSMRSLVDNAEVLHHWLLFKQPLGGLPSITENAVGAHPEGEMLYGWAPGGDDMFFDPDVGMEMDSSVLYQLEMHYNNTTGRAVPDASGVEICLTPKKPEHIAGLSWVGTDAILGSTEAVGLCTPGNTEPIHIISAQPHMHLAGKHMKVELTRGSGSTEVIHDEPFSFEYQKSYILDHVMMPGDSLTTTCTYSQPSVFGKGTNDEMCYFFTIHWPAGSLSSLGLGTAIHGANSCIAF